MRRRYFLIASGALLAAPLAADAQPAAQLHRIGYLSGGSAASPYHKAFQQGLRELGWIEGQNIAIDFRFADNRYERLSDLAADLVRLKVDLIVAQPTPAALAAKNATSTIPIVMINTGDPERLGLVASLARPGGNVTGTSFTVGLETIAKGLELLKEAVPRVRYVAVLEPNQSRSVARDQRLIEGGAVIGHATGARASTRSRRVGARICGDCRAARGGAPRRRRVGIH